MDHIEKLRQEFCEPLIKLQDEQDFINNLPQLDYSDFFQ